MRPQTKRRVNRCLVPPLPSGTLYNRNTSGADNQSTTNTINVAPVNCPMANQMPKAYKERVYLPHGVRVLARLDAGGVDRAVGLVSDVEHHDGTVVAPHRQERVVHRVEVEAHNLYRPGVHKSGSGYAMSSLIERQNNNGTGVIHVHRPSCGPGQESVSCSTKHPQGLLEFRDFFETARTPSSIPTRAVANPNEG